MALVIINPLAASVAVTPGGDTSPVVRSASRELVVMAVSDLGVNHSGRWLAVPKRRRWHGARLAALVALTTSISTAAALQGHSSPCLLHQRVWTPVWFPSTLSIVDRIATSVDVTANNIT
jgi:hypothetical protein